MSNGEHRAYPGLRFHHVVLTGVGAAILISTFWLVVVYVPAKRAYHRAKQTYALQRLGDAGHSFENLHRRPPTSAADLESFLQDNPEVFRALLDGELVMVWNAWQPGVKVNRIETVWGYHRSVLKKGGYILMGDGAVRWMYPDELKSASTLAIPPSEILGDPKKLETPHD